jgi:hypothetical protein
MVTMVKAMRSERRSKPSDCKAKGAAAATHLVLDLLVVLELLVVPV